MSVVQPALRRDQAHGWGAGVVPGLGERLGIDPLILRVGFVVLAVATGGLALVGYVVAWAALPATEGRPAPVARLARVPRLRGDWRVALGVGLLTLSCMLAFRELGIWWSDAVVWPLVAAAFGVALLLGRARAGTEEDKKLDVVVPVRAPTATNAAAAPTETTAPSSRVGDLYRGVFGVLLVIGAGLLFLSSNDVFGGLRDAALTTVVVVVALALILAPFLWRLGRTLASERAERIRSQERAELAAHLHDSVLQTLALMQKRADDPREVAALARRQERELRAWLNGRRPDEASLAAALEAAAGEVEGDHGVPVEVVTVGDGPLDARGAAIVAAAREALVNA